MCGWVIQAQQAYTEARVAACQTIDLQQEAAKGTIYPQAVISPGFPEDSCDEKLTRVFGTNPEIHLTAADRAITEGSPILGMYSCRFSLVAQGSFAKLTRAPRKIL